MLKNNLTIWSHCAEQNRTAANLAMFVSGARLHPDSSRDPEMPSGRNGAWCSSLLLWRRSGLDHGDTYYTCFKRSDWMDWLVKKIQPMRILKTSKSCRLFYAEFFIGSAGRLRSFALL